MTSITKTLTLLIVLGLICSCTPSEPRKVRKGCLDCHPELVEKYATGHVHQPVAAGECKKCHRPHGMVGGVYLRTPQPELCLGCHEQLKKELMGIDAEHLHRPLITDKCTLCHQPHNAENGFLLDKPAAQSCFNCHDEAQFTKSNQHQPLLDEGCQSCHDAHGSANGDLLKEPVEKICQRCHDLDDNGFTQKHAGYPVKNGCLSCHDVHSSERPALLRPVLHQPTAELACSKCHLAADSETPFALKSAGSDLCRSCHDVESKAQSDPLAHPPVQEGECLGCHAPHASDFRGMTIKDTGSLCLGCHQFKGLEDTPKGLQKKGDKPLHEPLLKGDCLACHEAHQPHPGEKNLLRDNVDKLCSSCHDTAAASHRIEHPPTAVCHTCHQPHESKEPALLIKSQRQLCSSCHENIMEEFSLNSQHRPFVAGDCGACHTLHGGDLEQLLQVQAKDLCQRCHQQVENQRTDAFRHQPFKDGDCLKCHAVHSADEPYLLAGSGEILCLGCHAEQRPSPDDKVVHKPVAVFNCIACHNAHGIDRKAFLLQDEPTLCLRCHDIDRDWKSGSSHQPAASGDCEACHAAHFGDRQKLLLAEPFALCSKCHELDRESFKKSHQGIGWGSKQCLNCHDPHGAPAPGEGLLLPYRHKPFNDQECSSCHGGNS